MITKENIRNEWGISECIKDEMDNKTYSITHGVPFLYVSAAIEEFIYEVRQWANNSSGINHAFINDLFVKACENQNLDGEDDYSVNSRAMMVKWLNEKFFIVILPWMPLPLKTN